MHHYRDPPRVVEFPCLRDHRLGLHLAGPMLLDNVCDGRRVARWSDGGHVSLVPAGLPVTRTFKGRPDVLQVYITPALVDGVAEEAFDRDPAHIPLVPRLVVRDDILDRLGRLLLAEAKAHAPGGRLAADALTRALVVHLLRHYSSLAPRAPDRADNAMPGWRLRRVVEFMHANLAEDMPLARLSAASGLRPTQFARTFRAATGEPPHQYLIRLRIEQARGMLEGTTLPVIEVGLRCGFGQPNHFATMFRKLTGLSPRAYRHARQA